MYLRRSSSMQRLKTMTRSGSPSLCGCSSSKKRTISSIGLRKAISLTSGWKGLSGSPYTVRFGMGMPIAMMRRPSFGMSVKRASVGVSSQAVCSVRAFCADGIARSKEGGRWVPLSLLASDRLDVAPVGDDVPAPPGVA